MALLTSPKKVLRKYNTLLKQPQNEEFWYYCRQNVVDATIKRQYNYGILNE
jgi:hypothetical protein